MASKILAISTATDKREGLTRSLETLRRCGIDSFVYGLGEKWNGNGMKQIGAWKGACKNLGKYEYVLVLDGYDTLTIAREAELVYKFHAFHHPMVIATERNCWPDNQMAEKYPSAPSNSKSGFRYLNAGAYMAQIEYAAWILKAWGINDNFKADSDQRFLTQRFLEDTGCMCLDYDGTIFQCLCGLKPCDFISSGKRFINKKTKQVPCVMHGNGHTDMEWYWSKIK